jgi:hypothetical protein
VSKLSLDDAAVNQVRTLSEKFLAESVALSLSRSLFRVRYYRTGANNRNTNLTSAVKRSLPQAALNFKSL